MDATTPDARVGRTAPGDAAPAEPCADDPCAEHPLRVCEAGTGRCVCQDQCATEGVRCDGGYAMRCVLSDGCLAQLEPEPCTGGVCADAARCGFTVGGRVDGLSGTLTLSLDGDANLPLTMDGAFVFGKALADAEPYHVRITAQPEARQCSIRNGRGLIASANISDLELHCEGMSQRSLSQVTYAKPSRTGRLDYFGTSVAISGDGLTMAIGVPGEDSSGRGIDPPQEDNDTGESGAVFIYASKDGQWQQQAFLKPPGAATGYEFGQAVALNGDVLAVGAPGQPLPFDAGAVYVYVRQGETWSLQAQLSSPAPDALDRFGAVVALDGHGRWLSEEEGTDTLVVGVAGDDSSFVQSPNDNSTSNSGGVYVFVRDRTRWLQQAFLKASNAGEEDRFGTSLDVSGDFIAVGAPNEDGAQADGMDDGAADSGAVYLFERAGGTWTQRQYLKADVRTRGDLFGTSTALSGSLLAVGAVGDDRVASDAGAVHVFNGASGVFVHTAVLTPATMQGAGLGGAAALRGHTLVASAPGDAMDGAGIDPAMGTPTLPRAGAAYLWDRRAEGSWILRHYLKAPNPGPGDHFGQSLSCADGAVLIGAPREDSATTLFDGADGDEPIADTAYDGGAAYVWR